MGLVVQSTADALFAPLTAVTASATGEGAAPEGGFATILAALTAPKGANNELAGAILEALAPACLPLPEAEKAPCDGEDPLAGAVAAALALAMAPAPVQPQPAAEVASTAQAPETASVAVTEATSSPVEALAEPTAPALAAPFAPPKETPVAETGADTPAPSTAADVPASFEAVTPAPADVTTETPGALPVTAAVAPATEAAPARRRENADSTPPAPEPGKAPIASGPVLVRQRGNASDDPPGERREKGEPPPGKQDIETISSVVRFAGNAIDKSQGNGPAASSAQPTLAPAEKPTPNASAQGIAHAAANSAVGQLRENSSPAPVTTPVDAPAPTPAPAVPPQVEQVSSAILDRVEAGGGEASIHLEPAELGEITIRVRTVGDHVQVEVHAERPAAAQLLREHTADLSSLLGSRGLDLSDVYVGTGRGQGHNDADGAPWRRAKSQDDGFAELLGIEGGAPAQQHHRLRAAYNPNGAHDFLV